MQTALEHPTKTTRPRRARATPPAAVALAPQAMPAEDPAWRHLSDLAGEAAALSVRRLSTARQRRAASGPPSPERVAVTASRDLVAQLAGLVSDPSARETLMLVALRELAWTLAEQFEDKRDLARQFERMAGVIRENARGPN